MGSPWSEVEMEWTELTDLRESKREMLRKMWTWNLDVISLV